MNKTSIIILTYNNLTYNQQCIESIREHTPKGSYEIIVVDNHSTDGTVDWLEQQGDLKLILNKDNKGFPAGCNQGIKAAAAGNDILLLNNDTIVTPNWLDNLQACLSSDPCIGAAGAVTNACSNFQTIAAIYTDIEGIVPFARKINVSNPKAWKERIKLIGFCLLIKNEVIRKVGLLDEAYGLGNYEDDDYSIRVRQAGYKLMLCYDCFIHHFSSVSFTQENVDFVTILQKNSETFKNKWGFPTRLLSIDERFILTPFFKEIKSVRNILMVNPGFGAMILYFRQKFPKAQISGIETNRSVLSNARYCAEVYPDLNAVEGKKFDVIVFLTIGRDDVDMVPLLAGLPELLTDDGMLLFPTNKNTKIRFSQLDCFLSLTGRKMEGLEILAKFGTVPSTVEGKAARLLRQLESGIEKEKATEELSGLIGSGRFPEEGLERLSLIYGTKPANTLNVAGIAYFNAGNRQKAFEYFAKGFELDPAHRDNAFNLAYVLYEAKEKGMALSAIEKCGARDTEMMQLRQAVLSLE